MTVQSANYVVVVAQTLAGDDCRGVELFNHSFTFSRASRIDVLGIRKLVRNYQIWNASLPLDSHM